MSITISYETQRLKKQKRRLHNMQRKMYTIEGPYGHIPASLRYEYQRLVTSAKKLKEKIDYMEGIIYGQA